MGFFIYSIMKYLKTYKIFEAKLKTIQYKDMTDWGSTEPQKVNKQIEPEYFNLVFADFIDDGAEVESNTTEDHIGDYWEIIIKEPVLRGSRDIDNHIKTIEKLNELYLDVKSCINKVKDEFPNINVDFSIEEFGENNAWENTIERNIHLIFNYKQ